jgi:hypothetical protein
MRWSSCARISTALRFVWACVLYATENTREGSYISLIKIMLRSTLAFQVKLKSGSLELSPSPQNSSLRKLDGVVVNNLWKSFWACSV